MAYKRISPQPVAEGGTGAITLTAHGVLIGEGTSAITPTAVGTTGQVLTGVTASDPVWAAPAASSISITGNSGGALTGNAFTFTGGTTGLTFAGSGSTETLGGTLVVSNGGSGAGTFTAHGVLLGEGTSAFGVTAVGTTGQVLTGVTGADPVWAAPAASVFPWTATTADASLVVNNGYIANKAGLLTMTLPASATVGQVIAITNINTAVGWRIAQNASQQIFMGNQSTTSGVTGYLEATALGDTVNLICTTAGSSTIWQAVYLIGNITVN